MEDDKIVDLYWQRDEDAIKQTANKYGNYCYTIAYNILSNNEDAKECLNDTYLGAWNAIPPHRPKILATFLGKITRRLALNIWRIKDAKKRGGGEVALSLDELEECVGDNSLNEEIAELELKDMINDFLLNISESDRKIFVCRYFYFDSIEEISLRFTFSQSKVKMSLKRTRDKLKDYLLKRGVIV